MAENKNAKTPADGPEYERGFVEGMQRQMQLHVNRVIKTWNERCEEHPDHQERIISERMIQARMQEEIDELRQALETKQKTAVSPGKGTGFNYFRALGITSLRQALETEPEALRLAEWVGLADEQVEDEWERITGHSIFGGDRSEGRAMYISPNEVIEFSRAIEAKLREKNHG